MKDARKIHKKLIIARNIPEKYIKLEAVRKYLPKIIMKFHTSDTCS